MVHRRFTLLLVVTLMVTVVVVGVTTPLARTSRLPLLPVQVTAADTELSAVLKTKPVGTVRTMVPVPIEPLEPSARIGPVRAV